MITTAPCDFKPMVRERTLWREGTLFDMTLNLLGQELAAFVFYFLYESFFEWAFHKYLFHSPKFIKKTFKAHQLVHHQRYKFDPPRMSGRKVRKKTISRWTGSRCPCLSAFICRSSGPCSALPAGRACGAALPPSWPTTPCTSISTRHARSRRALVRAKLRVFRFVKEHHRIHHKYMQQNLNVFFPLADMCLGTYRSAASLTQKPEAHDAATPPCVPPPRSRDSARVAR